MSSFSAFPAVSRRRERQYIEEARQLCPLIPEGKLEPHESPDFLLDASCGPHATGVVIGFEVEELRIEKLSGEFGLKELLEFSIAAANQKIAEYRRAAPVVWLLIVAEQSVGTGGIEMGGKDLARGEFAFDFDEVLLFVRETGGGGEVFSLKRS